MAVDVCSTSEDPICPRISFSHELDDPSSDSLDPTRSDRFQLSPSFDFSFCTTSSPTPADELFSNGQILPTQIKTPQNIQILDPITNLSKSPNSIARKKRLKEFIFRKDQEQEHEQEKSASKSFWQFTRSVSLNCDSNKGTKGLLRSLSIKSLSRSHSTGSALNPKRDPVSKVVEKSKESMFLRRCTSLNQPPPSSTHVYYSYRNSNNSKSSRGGITIIPILNVPPAYNISKGTINFFGFGSLFCNGKVKRKTKL
ncbi:uncharacterized protein [Rutidosis leptorrhynchoides]|uniref:uncharacterized protein n=1 Tax=Rutidosis leptorrhynchoides TaxID=125765 RepID=UPI003A98F1B0